MWDAEPRGAKGLSGIKVPPETNCCPAGIFRAPRWSRSRGAPRPCESRARGNGNAGVRTLRRFRGTVTRPDAPKTAALQLTATAAGAPLPLPGVKPVAGHQVAAKDEATEEVVHAELVARFSFASSFDVGTERSIGGGRGAAP